MKLVITWLGCIMLSAAALAAPDTILFAVNEGTSSSTDAVFRIDKYADLARHLSTVVGKNVKMETSNILSILVRNLERQRYDVLLVRPSHISAKAMRDHGYRLLVVAKGESRVHFLVNKDSPLKTLKDVEGRFLVLPDKLAYPTHVAMAVLRDEKLKPGRLQLMDRQEAVGYAVQTGLADVGVVISYSKVAKEWEKEGGRFLYTKDKLPFWSVIVSPKVTEATASKLKQALLDLDKTPAGQEMLKKVGVPGFVEGNQQAYLDMLKWIEGK
ncbi:MAG: phosphate/phosphite/phosphonate ABC transporter substrate-binding protein [Thiobacillaceae bacterium]